MKALLVIPTLALLALGAHFLRSGEPHFLLACLCCCVLCWIPRPWAQRTVQGVLLFGAAEWGLTLAALIAQRRGAGLAWGRLAAILGTVALLTGLSALLFQLRGLDQDGPGPT